MSSDNIVVGLRPRGPSEGTVQRQTRDVWVRHHDAVSGLWASRGETTRGGHRSISRIRHATPACPRDRIQPALPVCRNPSSSVHGAASHIIIRYWSFVPQVQFPYALLVMQSSMSMTLHRTLGTSEDTVGWVPDRKERNSRHGGKGYYIPLGRRSL